MALIKCKECGNEISQKAKKCPHCGAPTQEISTVAGLFIIVLVAFLAFKGVGLFIGAQGGGQTVADLGSRVPPALESPTLAASRNLEPQLLLIDWSWKQSHGYAIAEGQVKNISTVPLDNVKAFAEFYTADRKFITSDSSLIEYRPLLPGQISPFKVYASWNPAMSSALVDFKTFSGGPILWTKEQKFFSEGEEKGSGFLFKSDSFRIGATGARCRP